MALIPFLILVWALLFSMLVWWRWASTAHCCGKPQLQHGQVTCGEWCRDQWTTLYWLVLSTTLRSLPGVLGWAHLGICDMHWPEGHHQVPYGPWCKHRHAWFTGTALLVQDVSLLLKRALVYAVHVYTAVQRPDFVANKCSLDKCVYCTNKWKAMSSNALMGNTY